MRTNRNHKTVWDYIKPGAVMELKVTKGEGRVTRRVYVNKVELCQYKATCNCRHGLSFSQANGVANCGGPGRDGEDRWYWYWRPAKRVS